MAKKMRIFVKGLNWVGDAIIATPALAHLRQSFPEAEITLMVRPWVEPVYRYNPDIDRLWVHNDSKNIREFISGVNRVRGEHFSLGIALPNSVRSALLLWLGRGAARGL
jgi:heptosyltransferase II